MHKIKEELITNNQYLAELRVRLAKYEVTEDLTEREQQRKDTESIQIADQTGYYKCQAAILQLFPDLDILILEAPKIQRHSEAGMEIVPYIEVG